MLVRLWSRWLQPRLLFLGLGVLIPLILGATAYGLSRLVTLVGNAVPYVRPPTAHLVVAITTAIIFAALYFFLVRPAHFTKDPAKEDPS